MTFHFFPTDGNIKYARNADSFDEKIISLRRTSNHASLSLRTTSHHSWRLVNCQPNSQNNLKRTCSWLEGKASSQDQCRPKLHRQHHVILWRNMKLKMILQQTFKCMSDLTKTASALHHSAPRNPSPFHARLRRCPISNQRTRGRSNRWPRQRFPTLLAPWSPRTKWMRTSPRSRREPKIMHSHSLFWWCRLKTAKSFRLRRHPRRRYISTTILTCMIQTTKTLKRLWKRICRNRYISLHLSNDPCHQWIYSGPKHWREQELTSRIPNKRRV